MNTPSASVYTAANDWAQRALGAGSGVLLDRPVWDVAVVADLRGRLQPTGLAPREPFELSWRARLTGAPDTTIQLAAETLWVHLLFPSDIGGAHKRELVRATLALADDPVAVPPDLDAVLDHGVAPSGTAYKMRRRSQLSLLLSAATALRHWPDPEVVLSDPWACRAWLRDLPDRGAQSQREVLLHLLHPEVFEPIVSVAIKRRIVAAFPQHVPEHVTDIDAALHHIRAALEPKHGPTFRFTDPALQELWR